MVETYFAPLARGLAVVIERDMRSGELQHLDPVRTAISLSAPMIRMIGGYDPYQKNHQRKRKQELLKFIGYALSKDPEA